ncbi:MAG: nuclear transport factor 2 family protein [Planctomycetes bacterium]|nr:nuclear transport factor 2 family protein [Planctomycetota bacterium]
MINDHYSPGDNQHLKRYRPFTALCDDRNSNKASNIITRQTGCFVKTESGWQLIHQHVSLPLDFYDRQGDL